MSAFPLEPNLSKMLIVSEELGCSEEILTIVALLSVPAIFFRFDSFYWISFRREAGTRELILPTVGNRPRKKQKLADAAKAEFFSTHGDLITYLNAYNAWLRMDRSEIWCSERFLNSKALNEAYYIREQLFDIMKA